MGNNFSTNEEDDEEVVTNWLEAVNDFRTQYLTLITLTSQPQIQVQDYQSTTLYIGQCPLDSLLTLLVSMKVELESLAYEMDQIDLFTAITNPQHCKRLRDHTHRLNRLSKKAQIRLQLVEIPSS